MKYLKGLALSGIVVLTANLIYSLMGVPYPSYPFTLGLQVFMGVLLANTMFKDSK